MPATSAEILARLVAFDTTSRNSNRALIDYARGILDAHGVAYRISESDDGAKANIHAVIGPHTAGGLAFSGHVDTVPVDGQAWSADPFALRRQDGRLIGRGTTDMKGFVACCLAAVPDLAAMRLAAPIHLFISYDEEVDCAGARRLVDDLDASGLRPALCIVGEPSSMQPIVAHKGRLAAAITARGKPGHSSRPAAGVNAIAALAEAVVWLSAEARRAAADGPFAEGFDPPHTTIHVGRIEGGTVLNIIPEHARCIAEWRTIPGDDCASRAAGLRAHIAARIAPWMQAVDPATGIEVAILDELPDLSLPPAHPLADLVRQATGANGVGRVSYGTEAGLFQRAGIASIVCGPGDIAQAHQPDEWIAEAELARCDAFIRRVARQFAAA